MAAEFQIINKPVGTAEERTAWINEYKTAVDNGFSLVFGGMGTNLVALMTKPDAMPLPAQSPKPLDGCDAPD